MPRDFGDWLGGAKPMDFNDPTQDKPKPKCDGNHGGTPCADPECWLRDHRMDAKAPTLTGGGPPPRQHPGAVIADAVRILLGSGFKHDIYTDSVGRPCACCGFQLVVPALEAADYLRRHKLHGTQPDRCINCNKHARQGRYSGGPFNFGSFP